MTCRSVKVLVVAAATRKIGHVLFVDGTPYHWRVTAAAATSPEHAYEYVTQNLKYYRPQLIVTERLPTWSRKGAVSRGLLAAVAKAAKDAGIPVKLRFREQTHANKYAEAACLAEQFPELAPYLPKPRKPWQSEPRRTILFEAVALGVAEGSKIPDAHAISVDQP